LLRLAAEVGKKLEGENADAAAGGFLTTFDAVVLDGLAGDAGGVEAVIFLPLITHPGHFAPGGAHVRRGNVLIGAEDVVDLVNEAASDPLQLLDAELAW